MKPSLFWVVLVSTIACSAPSLAQDKVRLIGSGASFPFPIYSAWFKAFGKTPEGAMVDYQAKGSGAGVQDLINKTVDFAATDSGMSDDQMKKVPGGVQLLPMTAGEVVLAYNLPGVKGLKLPRDVYPAIFLGKITKWNDPKIVAANPGAKLPDQQITVVRRAEAAARHSYSRTTSPRSVMNGRRGPALETPSTGPQATRSWPHRRTTA